MIKLDTYKQSIFDAAIILAKSRISLMGVKSYLLDNFEDRKYSPFDAGCEDFWESLYEVEPTGQSTKKALILQAASQIVTLSLMSALYE
jgi:hypothetical protein